MKSVKMRAAVFAGSCMIVATMVTAYALLANADTGVVPPNLAKNETNDKKKNSAVTLIGFGIDASYAGGTPIGIGPNVGINAKGASFNLIDMELIGDTGIETGDYSPVDAVNTKINAKEHGIKTGSHSPVTTNNVTINISDTKEKLSAQDIQRAAAGIITDTADKICGSIALSGQNHDVKVAGDIKAETKGLAERIARLGLSGSAEYSASHYENVIRADLPQLIKDTQECKKSVFNSLKNDIFPHNPEDKKERK